MSRAILVHGLQKSYRKLHVLNGFDVAAKSDSVRQSKGASGKE